MTELRVNFEYQTLFDGYTSSQGSADNTSSNSGYIPLVSESALQGDESIGLTIEHSSDGNILTATNPQANSGNRINPVLNGAITAVRNHLSGVTLSDEQCLRLLCNYNFKTQDELVANEATRNAAIDHVKKTYDYVKSVYRKDQPITFEDLCNYTARYSVVLRSGWNTIDSFEKRQAQNRESITERIARTSSIDNIQELPEEGQIEALKTYFRKYTSGSSSLQLTDFTKLLFNSNGEELRVMKNAVIALNSENRSPALDRLFDCITDAEAKLAMGNSMDGCYLEQVYNTPDMNGQVMTREQIRNASFVVGNNQDHAHRTAVETHFTARAREILTEENRALYERYKNGEELTGEDLEKAKAYERELEVQAGHRGGYTQSAYTNTYITNEEREEELTACFNNTREYINEIYESLVEETTQFVANNQDKLAVSQQEAEELLNKSTNGDYQKYYTSSSDNNKTSQSSNSNNSSNSQADSTSIGFPQKYTTKPDRTFQVTDNGIERLSVLQNEHERQYAIQANQLKYSPEFNIIVATGTIEQLEEFLKHNNISKVACMTEILGRSNTNDAMQTWAENIFEISSKDIKITIFKYFTIENQTKLSAKMTTDELEQAEVLGSFANEIKDRILAKREEEQ